MSKIRAKLKVTNVESHESCEMVTMSAVCKDDFDSSGVDENNTFALFTPSATLKMDIRNPDLIGTIKEGQQYYLDFCLVQ